MQIQYLQKYFFYVDSFEDIHRMFPTNISKTYPPIFCLANNNFVSTELLKQKISCFLHQISSLSIIENNFIADILSIYALHLLCHSLLWKWMVIFRVIIKYFASTIPLIILANSPGYSLIQAQIKWCYSIIGTCSKFYSLNERYIVSTKLRNKIGITRLRLVLWKYNRHHNIFIGITCFYASYGRIFLSSCTMSFIGSSLK